jgi:hypothetical protein
LIDFVRKNDKIDPEDQKRTTDIKCQQNIWQQRSLYVIIKVSKQQGGIYGIFNNTWHFH